ncbi:MAG: LLM class flavin-dependent oxidoreductase [Dehalococcoidia bacterium]|nr:LLM class flavin-dependent oxidoreductase [Dehalococcoidia bacterium]
MKLSVLDQSPIRVGGTPRDAVLATIDLARLADRLGYTRYWLAEHHNTQTLASPAPEILIPALAAATEGIRVGSGGVMLSHYSPLKVAESFRMLETLYPGRIDLGLGRAPGSDRYTAAALQPGPVGPPLESYPNQVTDVLNYMHGGLPEDHPYHGITAMPSGPDSPETWLLASSIGSATYAARLGLPLSWAHFINPDGGPDTVARYRETFQPSEWMEEPRVNIGISAICAESTEEARRLGLSRHLMRLRRDQGRPLEGIPAPELALEAEFSQGELAYIAQQQERVIEGDPDLVKRGILEIAQRYDVDEVIVLTITHDYEDRKRSYELLAGAFDLETRD